MSPRSLFQSRTFRLTLVYLCLFSAAVLVVSGAIYWRATGAVSRQIDATIDAEIRGLAEQYARRGTLGLIDILDHRLRAGDRSGALYLLADPGFRRLAGNLDRWPVEQPDADGWLTFRLEDPDAEGAGSRYGRARVFDLTGGLHLLVGHDVAERIRIADSIQGILAMGLAIAVGVSLLGGVLMSRLLLRRFDSINRTAREIIAGDLDQRVPQSSRGDEFDQVAANLNAMLDQIQKLMAGMEQVTDNVAHDLRTPLARLRSRLENALNDGSDQETQRDAIERALGDTDNMLKTFNALLSIGRARSGVPRRGFEPVNLRQLIFDIEELYEPVADQRGLSLTIEAGGEAIINGDRPLLFQAVANLVDNAIKFSPAGGNDERIPITVRLDLAGTQKILIVDDHGQGIPERLRERVVDRFYRIEASRSTPGSGLGLSLVAAVADLHGGRLVLGDNHPGLRAELRFPAA